jgi:hypothetical protein
MKHFLLVLLLLALGKDAFADPMFPRDIIQHAITLAKENKTKELDRYIDTAAISSEKTNPISKQECIALLKSIDPKSLVLEKWSAPSTTGAKFEVNLTAPARMTFIFRCEGFPAGEPIYKIVGLKRDGL